MLAADAAQPAGWAHLVALAVAILIAVLCVSGHQWWMGERDPSPTPPDEDGTDLTPGETGDLTPDDTTDDTGWWGRRITLADGSRVVRYRPDSDYDDEPNDDQEETRDEMADRLVASGGRYSDAVREIMNAYDCSESTAKRAIAAAQERRGQRS